LVTNQLDDLAMALQDHGVTVDRTARKVNWYLVGRNSHACRQSARWTHGMVRHSPVFGVAPSLDSS
jgi:hypothetical protein